MTKQDYKRIAAALSASEPVTSMDFGDIRTRKQWQTTVMNMVNAFADQPNFDKSRFFADCNLTKII